MIGFTFASILRRYQVCVACSLPIPYASSEGKANQQGPDKRGDVIHGYWVKVKVKVRFWAMTYGRKR
jgi:hypothetical protein